MANVLWLEMEYYFCLKLFDFFLQEEIVIDHVEWKVGWFVWIFLVFHHFCCTFEKRFA